jgi:hypothetical protein
MDWKSVSSFFGREIVQTFCIAQSTMSVWTTTHSTRPYPILGPLRTETTRNLLECTATVPSYRSPLTARLHCDDCVCPPWCGCYGWALYASTSRISKNATTRLASWTRSIRTHPQCIYASRTPIEIIRSVYSGSMGRSTVAGSQLTRLLSCFAEDTFSGFGLYKKSCSQDRLSCLSMMTAPKLRKQIP